VGPYLHGRNTNKFLFIICVILLLYLKAESSNKDCGLTHDSNCG